MSYGVSLVNKAPEVALTALHNCRLAYITHDHVRVDVYLVLHCDTNFIATSVRPYPSMWDSQKFLN